jgi:FAD/FMN-containing dehydrogenase
VSSYYNLSFNLNTLTCIVWGGAIANISSNETSFSYRNTLFSYQLYASSGTPPYPQSDLNFVQEWWGAIANNVTKAPAYTNYIDPLLTAEVWPTAYYNGSFERLTAIKSTVDPLNIFRFNQSIPLLVKFHDSEEYYLL